jgi:citrate lyase beta subunit
MHERKWLPRRACLIVPANSPRRLTKSLGLRVDEVIIDFEDAIPAADKTSEMRSQVAALLSSMPSRAPIVAFRANAVGTRWFRDDISQLLEEAGQHIHSVVVPKVESATQIEVVDGLLSELEDDFGLEPLTVEAQIESALGLLKAEEVAASSVRLVALIFGAGDFAASLGIPQTVIGAPAADYVGDRWHYARSRIATAAHAYGLAPVDSPYAAFDDANGLRETAHQARAVGFVGKWAIHPAQIDPCLEVFTPTASEVDEARRVLEVLDKSVQSGLGVAADGGVMIDEASRRIALALLARANA